MAPLLAFLRELQRRFGLAVVLVHHARKGAGKERAGQALRGSSEFHAWGDSNLYLRRREEQLMLTVEHRAAPSRTGLPLELRQTGEGLALEIAAPSPVSEQVAPSTSSLNEQLRSALNSASGPLTVTELRRRCRARTSTVCDALAKLHEAGLVRKTEQGYLRA